MSDAVTKTTLLSLAKELESLANDEIEEDAMGIKFLVKYSLLNPYGKMCPKCHRELSLVRDRSKPKSHNLQCPSRSCNCKQSPFKGSWIESSKMSIKNIMYITYMWALGYKQYQVMHEIGGCSSETIVDWYAYLREVCQQRIMVLSVKIGGFGVVVEIDESMFFKRKYHRGKKRSNQQWVLGGIERGSRRCFMVAVPNRTAETLIPIIMEHVAPGTLIITDCWKSYNTLSANGFSHLTVNHSIQFVDSTNPLVHTNSIEGLWAHAKRIYPKTGTSEGLRESYLSEFMWRRRIDPKADVFTQIVKDISIVYPNGILPE